jgi:hypothetical protein
LSPNFWWNRDIHPHVIPSTLLPWFRAAWLFLFSKLKIAKTGTRFEIISLIKQIVTRKLKAIREEAFSRAFHSLCAQCIRWTEAGKDYIE